MLFALIGFVVLLGFGIVMEELTWPQVGLCLLLAIGALAVIIALQWPSIVFSSALALLDVVLVLVVFKGDIQIR
jgi:hypothetical protein